jgi:hypothetical protein
MARFLVHGLVVETVSSLGWDPGAELLAGFPAAGPGQEAELTIDVKPGRVEAPDPSSPVDVILLQANVRAVLTAVDVRIEAPGFLGRVPLSGGVVEAVVAEDGPERQALVHVHVFLVLAAALRLRGWYHLHAACTVMPDGAALLIVGQGGSGKSTLCAALVAAGHRYLGDDVLFLEDATGRLLAFPRPFHLGPEAASAIPGVAAHLDEPYGARSKRALDALAAFPGQAERSAGPPRALLFPRVDAGRAVTAVEARPSVEGAALLIESSAFVAGRLPGHREHLAALGRLADGGPAYRVTLGRDLLEDAPGTARRIAASSGTGSI